MRREREEEVEEVLVQREKRVRRKGALLDRREQRRHNRTGSFPSLCSPFVAASAHPTDKPSRSRYLACKKKKGQSSLTLCAPWPGRRRPPSTISSKRAPSGRRRSCGGRRRRPWRRSPRWRPWKRNASRSRWRRGRERRRKTKANVSERDKGKLCRRGEIFAWPSLALFIFLSKKPFSLLDPLSSLPFLPSLPAACPLFPPSAPLLRASPPPARPPLPARRAPPLPWPRPRCGEEKREREERRRIFFRPFWFHFNCDGKKHAFCLSPFPRFHSPSPRPPQATHAGPPPRGPPYSRLSPETHTFTGLHCRKQPPFNKFSIVTLSTFSASSPSPSKVMLLSPAKAASAEASTSLYDRLGGDAINLVTSMLFDK